MVDPTYIWKIDNQFSLKSHPDLNENLYGLIVRKYLDILLAIDTVKQRLALVFLFDDELDECLLATYEVPVAAVH